MNKKECQNIHREREEIYSLLVGLDCRLRGWNSTVDFAISCKIGELQVSGPLVDALRERKIFMDGLRACYEEMCLNGVNGEVPASAKRIKAVQLLAQVDAKMTGSKSVGVREGKQS